jgi:hypothetical protein
LIAQQDPAEGSDINFVGDDDESATSTANLGGPFQGYSPQQTQLNFKDSEQIMTRRILTKAWNGQGATGTANGKTRVITPFRAINNLGDFLGRINYVCGGSNQINKTYPGRQGPIGSIISQCDRSGVQSAVCNGRFVPDASDYITFKKQRALNQNYNDLANGCDQHNASNVNLMAFRRR